MLNFLNDNNNNLKFKKIADDFQLILNDASDLESIIHIDPSLWAVTSLPIDNVVFNYDFLLYIDQDKNKKIHPIEFINALKWLFSILSKYDGINTESENLHLTNLNRNNCQIIDIIYTTRKINTQLKIKPKNIIDLNTVLNYKIDNIDDQKFLHGYNLLKKLLLFQRYMIQFANNYVTLDSLYNPHTLSIMQPGYLIMNGNYYTLGAKVDNIQQHKQIIKRSNICTIYVEITSQDKKYLFAFAITNGIKQNFYIGKTGIYIDRRDNSQWDAKIIDIVDEPISILQAITSPFTKIHNLLIAKINKKMQQDQSAFLNDKPQNELTNFIQLEKNNPNNQSNMFTSIGIAALGSAGAFIISALHTVSILTILSFIISLILLMSIPIIVIAMYKLYNRSITEFYTASGWAINPNIRLQHKMGVLFTYSPKNTIIMKIVKDDLIQKFLAQFETPFKKIKKIILIILSIIIILAISVVFCLKLI